MLKEKFFNILIFLIIHCIYLFDIIKKKRRSIITLTLFLSVYSLVTYMRFEMKMKNKMSFFDILNKLPLRERRLYVWQKAYESLNNQTMTWEFRNETMKSNQTMQQLIDYTIQRYKVGFSHFHLNLP